jgi:carbon storage regulator CsrA
MLVLARKHLEEIKIGDGIVVSVLKISNKEVRIGVTAPKEVKILRAELPVHDEPAPATSPE